MKKELKKLQKEVNNLVKKRTTKEPINLTLEYTYLRDKDYFPLLIIGGFFIIMAIYSFNFITNFWHIIGFLVLLLLSTLFFLASRKSYKNKNIPEYGTNNVYLSQIVSLKIKEEKK